ncbi:ATP-binding cassette domain-containing protein [Streptomyces sp. NPDC098789]|uniref:ATP-binding cassette domain-containing protein n=1 Tax=Streptomyces sp. NPDC098789 TaxID=3366098 RepID=UPI0038195190
MLVEDDRWLWRHRVAVVLCIFPAGAWLLWLLSHCAEPLAWLAAVIVLSSTVIPLRGMLHSWARLCLASTTEAGALLLWVLIEQLADGATGFGWATISGLALIVVLAVGSVFDLLMAIGRRTVEPRAGKARDLAVWPGICVQVPAHNEPPELLISTLRQLLLQDYPGRWMIQVIDNNTPSPRTWKPVKDFCEGHEGAIDFIHLENWPGHKAGALNEGIRQLPNWVEHIAVVDADYLVEPGFLRLAAKHLASPDVAFVQVPQHYRQWQESSLHEGVFHMYEQYYAAIVPARAQANGLICVGTMAVLRRRAVEEAGLWNEESVTEDAELSLRLLARGWRGLIDPMVMGTGLMPFDFAALRQQRFRWAFGMIHVLRVHRRAFLYPSKENRSLSMVQRLSYVGLALQYLSELIPLAGFALTALALAYPPAMPPPVGSVLLFSLCLYVWAATIRMTLAVRGSKRHAICAILGGLAVHWAQSWTMSQACLSALVHRRAVFLRTPKTSSRCNVAEALKASRTESGLALTAGGLAIWAAMEQAPLAAVTTGLAAIVYGCAPVVSLAYQRCAMITSAPVIALELSGTKLTTLASNYTGDKVVVVTDLCHRFGDREVLHGISFTVNRGEFFGILGPNGAGKTTTLEILQGMHRPSGGAIQVLGRDTWPRNPALLRQIGVQLQSSAFFDHLTAREQLETFAALHRVPRARADQTLELVGLAGQAGIRESRLSGGQRQRLAIACALIHAPDLLFLDEPTAALDPEARRMLWNLLGNVQARGTTIVYTTHHLDEAELLCDRVAVMDQGRILDIADPHELIRSHGGPTRVSLNVSDLPLNQAEFLTAADAVRINGTALTITTRKPNLLLAELAEHTDLHSVRVHSPTLEGAYLALTSKKRTAP